MKNGHVLAMVVLGILILATHGFGQEDPWNIELLGRAMAGDCAAVYPHGDYCLIGGGCRLIILDVSDPADPIEISHLYMPDIIMDIKVAYDYAYIADYDGGLRIVDIIDIYSPVEVGFYEDRRVQAVDVDDEYAYISTDIYGLRIIDIFDPSLPFEVGHCDSGCISYDIDVQDDYAYMACFWYGFRVIDISDAFVPFVAGSLDTDELFKSVFVLESKAFLADENYGLRIFDITEPTTPVEVGSYPVPDIRDVSVVGDMACVVDYYDGLIMLDVSDITSPGEISRLTSVPGSELEIEDDYAYVGAHTSGLHIIDISDAASISETGQFGTNGGVTICGMCNYHNYLYAATTSNGVQIFDVSTPATPVVVGTFETSYYSIQDICNVDTIMYLASMNAFIVLSLSDPIHPAPVDSLVYGYEIMDMFIQGNRAYIANSEAGLRIVDISDPMSIVEIAHSSGYAKGVAVSGDHAYLITESNSIRIVDISDLSSIVDAGSLSYTSRAVSAKGNFLYLSGQYTGFRIYDISEPSAPHRVSFYYGEYSQYTPILFSGDIAFISYGDIFRAFDMSDPYHPEPVGYYPNAYVKPYCMSGDTIYACGAGYGMGSGLYIFRYTITESIDEPNTPATPLPENTALNAYPNPFNSSCRIETTKDAVIEIFDIRGNLVQNLGNTDVFTPTEDLPTGIYLVQVRTEKETITKMIHFVK